MTIYPDKYCVYYHKSGDELFYIGSGVSSRPFATADRTQAWYQYIEEHDNSYVIEIAAWFNTQLQARRFEEKQIRKLNPLTNYGWLGIYWRNRPYLTKKRYAEIRREAFRSHKPIAELLQNLTKTL